MSLNPLFRHTTVIVLLFISSFSYQTTIAQASLDGMPSPKEVITYFNGDNSKETLGKQYAALYILWDMVALHKVSDYRRQDTKKESALKKEYNAAMGDLNNLYNKTVDPSGKGLRAYAISLATNELKKDIVDHLLNEAARTKYYEINKADKVRADERHEKYEAQREAQEQAKQLQQETAERQRSAFMKKMLGFGLLIVPFTVFAFWQGRRRFYRTNASGIEVHSSYGEMIGTRLIEALAWIGVIISVIIGLLLILGFFN